MLSRLRLWHLLGVFLALGAWVSLTVPLGEGPDELPHYTVTRYIIQHGRLPDTAAEHEAFQPPLYYLLSAAVTSWIDTRDFVVKANADYDPIAPDAPKVLLLHGRAEAFAYQGWALAWHLMRLLSLAMGAVTIAALYAAVLAITADRTFALLCAALVAFLPGFIFMSALVSNDNLAAMLAALLGWRIVLLLKPSSSTDVLPPPTISSFILLGLLLGLGLLSKTSMLAFVATIGLALLAAARRGHWPWRTWFTANILVFAAAALLSGWYFVRNILLYGDWLAWPLVLAANEVRTAPLSIADWQHVLAQTYRSFWLEWIGIALDPAAQLLLALFALLALVGLSRYLARRSEPASRLVLALLVVHLLVIALSWVRWTQTVAGTGQARLFYPALLTLVLALALGLRALHPRLPWALAGVLLLLAFAAPLRNIAPAYAAAPRIAALPSSAQPISATFKDKLRLAGWELPTARRRPGDMLYVGLYWQALKDGDEDDWLKIQLLDAQDKFLLFKDGSPSAGRDVTDSWRRGELIASWHRLLIPANAPPGIYRLTVGIHPYGRKNWFPVQEENMWVALSDQLVLAEVTID